MDDTNTSNFCQAFSTCSKNECKALQIYNFKQDLS